MGIDFPKKEQLEIIQRLKERSPHNTRSKAPSYPINF